MRSGHWSHALVAAKDNSFREPFKTIESVRISKFIGKRVSDYRASVVEGPTAVSYTCKC